MENEAGVWVKEIAAIIAVLAGGAATVPLTNWLKANLGLSGRGAFIMAAAVALVVTLAGMVVDGFIAPELLSPDNLAEIVIKVFLGSQAVYLGLVKNWPVGQVLHRYQPRNLEAQVRAIVKQMENESGAAG